MDFGLPSLPACAAIVTQEVLDFGLIVGGRQEDRIAPEAGRAVAVAGHLDLPDHVIRLAPVQRRCLAPCRDIIAVGPTPPGPVVVGRLDGGEIIPGR